ncbi:hypothetical protein J2Z60_000025 [Lactobacillus colini]|uniref:S-layer protein C-terminal domain-containing protein n=1 Tax=Lactobacillus colini TaxID=1819254 RepID=A0ABS4MB61_9LACO|nr:SLAP domain-containing protein [Lactobacillus colini]MBP2056863.1 hypothetical protein [Lactobacillus colini]
MKFNKKISIVALAAMFVSPAILTESHFTSQDSTVQAATSLKGKINFVKDYDPTIIYNKNGVALEKQPDFNFNKAAKYYGGPIVANGAKDYAYAFVFGMPQAIIKGSRYADLGDGGYIKWSNIGSYSSKSGEFATIKNSYVYDKDGKRLLTYRGQKAYYAKNSTVNYVGKRYIYQPNSYLNIGNSYYINTDNVNNMDGKGVLKLNANTYVYNKNGQRTTYNGKSKLLKYDLVNYSGKKRDKTSSDDYYYWAGNKKYSVKNYKIKGQDYYYLGKGAYIKAINVGVINGHAVFRDGGSTYVIPKSDLFIYNNNLEQTTKSVEQDKKIKVDATKTTGEGDATQRWFRIAGTKGTNAQWLLWGDDSSYGYLVAENNSNEGYFTVRTRIE